MIDETEAKQAFDEEMEKESYYDPAKNPMAPFAQGVFPAHIVGCSIDVDRVIKGTSLADIYNPIYRIAEAAADRTYYLAEEVKDKDGNLTGEVTETEVSGERYVGREVKGSGIFRFKNPSGDSRFRGLKDNTGGNFRYMEFTEFIGIKPERQVVGGKAKFRLRALAEEDLLGKALYISVFESTWTSKKPASQGQEFKATKAVPQGPWPEGMESAPEDPVPF